MNHDTKALVTELAAERSHMRKLLSLLVSALEDDTPRELVKGIVIGELSDLELVPVNEPRDRSDLELFRRGLGF